MKICIYRPNLLLTRDQTLKCVIKHLINTL